MENNNRRKVDNILLTALKPGEKARVKKVNTNNQMKLRKLAAFGIFPGVDISMLQKYPALVIQVGYTQVALDENIASFIVVDYV